MSLSQQEQLNIIHSIPDSKLNELATHLANLKGSGKMKGSGWWGDAFKWLKTNIGPTVVSVGKTLLKDVLLPIIKQKVSQKLGGGLGLAGGKMKKGKGLKLAGSGPKAPHMIKGSQAAKDHMAKLRAMRGKKTVSSSNYRDCVRKC